MKSSYKPIINKSLIIITYKNINNMGYCSFDEYSESTVDTLRVNKNIFFFGKSNCINRYDFSYNISLWSRPYNDFLRFYLYINITKLDLNEVNLKSFSNDLSKLKSLRECHFSRNQLSEIPYSMKDLHNLRSIHLNSNNISCLPAFLDYLPNLSLLDVYDNSISYMYCSLEHLEYFDAALNYIEPETDNYDEQKINLRAYLNYSRDDYCKYFESSTSEESNDEYNTIGDLDEYETWDDDEDDYWTPDNTTYTRLDAALLWETFVNIQIKKGNFCPVDLHVKRAPQRKHSEYYIPGQFDDATSDEDD